VLKVAAEASGLATAAGARESEQALHGAAVEAALKALHDVTTTHLEVSSL
jgi:hypothetical protein